VTKIEIEIMPGTLIEIATMTKIGIEIVALMLMTPKMALALPPPIPITKPVLARAPTQKVAPALLPINLKQAPVLGPIPPVPSNSHQPFDCSHMRNCRATGMSRHPGRALSLFVTFSA